MSKSRDIADSAATINYIDGLTSDAQTQIDDLQTEIDNFDPLPSQTGSAGKFLTTDGSVASWGAVPSTGESDFTADEAISTGDAVYLKSSGNIAKSEIASASVGTSANIISSDTKAISICEDPVNDKFVVFYMDSSDGDKGKAVVGTRSGTTVTYGTPVTFFSGSLFSSSANNISSTYDEVNGQIIVAYATGTDGGGLLRAGTVSGTSITFHTELDTGEYAQASGVCYDPTVDKILYNYFSDSSTGKAKVISNSGTTLTVLDTQQYATSVNGYTADAVHLKDYITDGYNALSYNTGGAAYIKQAIINPSTFALTFGTSINVTDGTSTGYIFGSQTLAWSSAYQRLIVLFQNGPSGNYRLYTSLYSVNGTGWTRIYSRLVDSSFFSAPYEDFPAISISPDGLSATVAYVDVGSSGVGKLRMTTALSATIITLGSEFQFEANQTEYMSLAYNQSGSNFVVAYARDAGFPRGKYVVGTTAIPDNRASVIGFSQDTVTAGQTATVKTLGAADANQSGLTANAEYYLSSSDGSTLTTTVNGQKVGIALSDTEILVTARS